MKRFLNQMHHLFRFIPLIVLVLLFTRLAASPAWAATIAVSTPIDDSINNGNCTLREAILAAKSHAPRDLCPAGTGNDVITFKVNSVTVASALPSIAGGIILKIDGGRTGVTVNNSLQSGSVFTVNVDGNLTLANLTIKGLAYQGICIFSFRELTIRNTDFSECDTVALNGTMVVQSSTGGSIDTSGGTLSLMLTIDHSTMVGYTHIPMCTCSVAVGPGGATVTNSRFEGPGGLNSLGGGNMTIDHTIFNGNGIKSNATVTINDSIMFYVPTIHASIGLGSSGHAVITNSTLLEKVISASGASVTFRNSIVPACEGGGVIVNDFGNLAYPGPCGSIPVLDPMLGGFGIPLPGSPAIDNGLSAYCPSDDIFGTPRPLDGDGNGVAVCDSGAYEYQP